MILPRLTVMAFGLLTAPLVAQTDSTGKGGRVLTHTFTTPSREFVRVRLESTQAYRVQVNLAPVRLEVRPVSGGVQAPRVRAVFTGERLQVFALQPRVTAEYEIRVLGAADGPIRLLVDRMASKPLNP